MNPSPLQMFMAGLLAAAAANSAHTRREGRRGSVLSGSISSSQRKAKRAKAKLCRQARKKQRGR